MAEKETKLTETFANSCKLSQPMNYSIIKGKLCTLSFQQQHLTVKRIGSLARMRKIRKTENNEHIYNKHLVEKFSVVVIICQHQQMTCTS